MRYHTAARGPDISRNVIISGYVALQQLHECFAKIVSVIIDETGPRAGFALRAVVWRPLPYRTKTSEHYRNEA